MPDRRKRLGLSCRRRRGLKSYPGPECRCESRYEVLAHLGSTYLRTHLVYK